MVRTEDPGPEDSAASDRARSNGQADQATPYKELCKTYNAIRDFRAKLLGFLPLASGGGIFLLLQHAGSPFLFPVGVTGALVTVGLYLYELHNMNRCHELIEQGAKCEKWLTKDGPVQFFDKPREKKLVKAAAGVVYGAVCFGWLCVATLAANPGEQDKARSVAFRPFVIRRVPMPNDIEVLLRLNLEIGTKESEGDKDWFEGKVAPVLAFQRANSKREVVDRQAFLNGVAKSDPVQMRETEVDSIHVYGNRAVVTCIVAWKGKRFHNVRLFVRRPPEMEWELLGWANEPAP